MPLSPRERQVLEKLANGATRKQIAFDLSIKYGSVRWYIYNARKKLKAETDIHAVAIAVQLDCITIELARVTALSN